MSLSTNRSLLRRSATLSAAVMLILSACGGSDSGDTSDTTEASAVSDATSATEATDAPASDPEESEPSGETTTIEVVHAWAGSEGEAFQAVVDQFESTHPEISVNLVQIPFGEMSSQLSQRLAQGSGPDVMTALPGLIRLFSEQGFLQPMDEQWDQWIADGEYNQALRDVATATDGTSYGVWFKGNVNGLLWYKPAVLESLGIEPPTTWEEWQTGLDAAKEAGLEPVAVGGADGWPLTQWADPFILRGAGADTANALIAGETNWDDPGIVKGIDQLSEFSQAYFPDNTLDRGFVEATCAWARGDAAFLNQGAFVNLVAPAECDDSMVPGEDYTFVQMPSFDGSTAPTAISGDLFVVNKASANTDAAVAFATYLGSAEAQSVWAARGGYIAPNAQVSPDVYPDANDVAAAKLWPADASATAVYDIDDFIGGQIQSTEVESLQALVRDGDANTFVSTMVEVTDSVRDS